MTLKEIERQIEKARNAPRNPDGTYPLFDLLPRVYYKDLPAKLKAEADKFTVETGKAFLLELYPVGTFEEEVKQPSFLAAVAEALHTARYLIKSVDLTPPKLTGDPDIDRELLLEMRPVDLMGSDLVEAWEKVTGRKSDIRPNKDYGIIRQGVATNTMTKLRAVVGVNTDVDDFTGTATIRGENGFTAIIPHFSNIGSPANSTWRLFDMLISEHTETGAKSLDIQLPLEKFMELRGIKDGKEARKQVKKDLEILRVAAVNFTEPRRNGAPKNYYNLNISSGAGIRNGVIVFSLTDRFYQLLSGYPVMALPKQIYRLNDNKNPNSYDFFRKLSEHKNMNIGKKNENIISVKALADASKYLPSYKTVMSSDRHYDTRIITPFERDMDALADTLTWQYCHRNGEPLTDEELQNFNYQTFIECMVIVTWKDYPDQTARRERIEEARKEKKKREAKKGQKKGGSSPQKGG